MIENLNELARFVKGGADVLQKAIESEDNVSLELVEGSFVSDEELGKVKSKMFEDGKKEGHTIGYDFAMKDIKKDFGIDIEGKDRDTIVKTVKSSILNAAKVEPNKKISELESSLDNLRKQYESDIAAKDNEVKSYAGRLKDISIVSKLRENTPEIKGIKVDQFLTLAKTEYGFDFDDTGNLIASRNGQLVKDKMERPIPVKDILTDYATQNNWFGSKGRGGGDDLGGSPEFKTLTDVYRHMEENNIDPLSVQGEQLVENFKNT